MPGAWVEEPTPVKRLNLRYHYSRARDQSTNAVVLAGKGWPRALWQAFARTLDAIFFLAAAPVLGRYMVAKATHKLGIATGTIRGAMGRESRHYAPTAAQFHAEVEG
jgi:hypothetical protein